MGSTIQAEGGCNKYVTNRIRAGWNRWAQQYRQKEDATKMSPIELERDGIDGLNNTGRRRMQQICIQ